MSRWWFFRKWHVVERERAERAVQRAKRSVRVAKARRPVVEYLAKRMTEQGERNNFVERLNMHVRGSI